MKFSRVGLSSSKERKEQGKKQAVVVGVMNVLKILLINSSTSKSLQIFYINFIWFIQVSQLYVLEDISLRTFWLFQVHLLFSVLSTHLNHLLRHYLCPPPELDLLSSLSHTFPLSSVCPFISWSENSFSPSSHPPVSLMIRESVFSFWENMFVVG